MDKRVFEQFQKDEATAIVIYGRLAQIVKDEKNSQLLERIASDEKRHYKALEAQTGLKVKPRRLFAAFVVLMARLLGLTFALKLLERGEISAQESYRKVLESHPPIRSILEDEERHEDELLGMIEEERLEYVGSMVLGLNDALVELTGALAGLTFAFRNTELIALSGLITGIAASLSMASSEYLSHRADDQGGRALKASIYTGIAYIITVALLVLPYLILTSYVWALVMTMATAIVIILAFNFYISVTKDLSFKKHFFEMAFLSLGVAALSFGIGFVVRAVLGVEV
ncbi:MAG: VIT1/CCC1 transporter family protein [Spirochaetales bacterium]|nr:VIT1/CCC1 transporter family protein [Spirochaetales bacterium]